jgi:hypothetical protein
MGRHRMFVHVLQIGVMGDCVAAAGRHVIVQDCILL